MIFKNRSEAGRLLVQKLSKYKNNTEAVVLGLPRGGVVTAYEIAKGLCLQLDIICPRKIGAPSNPELALGAVTETGVSVFNKTLIDYLGVPESYLKQALLQEQERAKQRLSLYRKSRERVPLAGKIVILVDDGLATGATMRAAIASIRAEKANRIIVAVPVSSPDSWEEILTLVDEGVCLELPEFFQAVGQYYESFNQTEDQEVIQLLSEML